MASGVNSGRPVPGLPIGSAAPDFTLTDLVGVKRSLTDWLGLPVLVIFFDPTCRFCQALVPDLARLAVRRLSMPRRGVEPVVVLISTGTLTDNERIVYDYGLPFPLLLQEDLEVAERYRVVGTPMGYLVNAAGRIATPLTIGNDDLLALASAVTSLDAGPANDRTGKQSALPGLDAGATAPAFELPDLSGRTHTLEAWRGTRRLLVFFDPDSEPCNQIGPALARLASGRDDNGLQLIIISTGSIEANERAVRDHGLSCPVLIQTHAEVAATYHVPGTPCAYMVDEDGTIATPLAIGGFAVLSCAAAAQAQTGSRTLDPARSRPREIVCLVDEPPYGFAIRRIYREHGIRFTRGTEPWEFFRPALNRIGDAALPLLRDAQPRWIEAVPGVDVLATRRPLWATVQGAVGRDRAAGIMADTFLLDVDDDVARLAASAPDDVFVLKGPQQRRQGILLATGQQAVELRHQYLVAERFITHQLRFRDTTLHLRCYLQLVRRDRQLTAWMFDDAICGWAVQSGRAANQFEEWITHPDNPVPDDYPCSLTELCRAMALDFDTVWADIAGRVGTLVRCAAAASAVPDELERSTCFQLFGFDVIVKADLTTRIAEINALPEMDAMNPRYAAVKDRVVLSSLAAAGIIERPLHGFVRLEIERGS